MDYVDFVLPGIREMAVSAGMEDFALLLGMLGILGPIMVGIIAAAVSARRAEKRTRLKQLQKDEEARQLEAERQAEEQKRSEEAARLQEERIAEREQGAIQSYLGLIFQKLENHKSYPKSMEQSGLSGRVVLRFTVRSNGEVIDPQITKVTGHNSFADAALQILRQVGQLPSFPDEIRQRELTVEAPIAYRIENRSSPSMAAGKDELSEEIRRQNEQAAKRSEGERKRGLAREWVEVTKQWETQDKKGQPRNPAVTAMMKIQRDRAQKESDPDVRAWLAEIIRGLQRMLNQEDEQTRQLSPEELIGELANIVRTVFLVKSCSRCYENRMALIEVSPNARSIKYACTYCGKEQQRAAANSPDAQKVKELERSIIAVLGKAWFKTMRDGYRCTFSVPEATLPYQQATRPGQIAKAIRAEVWRRDNGQCVQCGSRENLHIDHIVPVSKGGATSVPNLQVLCQSCNLSKGAKI